MRSFVTFVCLLALATMAFLILVILFIVLVLILPIWLTLSVTLGRICTTIDTTSRRLAVSATLPRSELMLASSVRLFRLFHLHFNIRRILLSGERNPVLLLKFTQHMLRISFLWVDLPTLDNLLDFLNQDWSFLFIWNFKCTLHNIVGKLVVNHPR